jgi:UDP-3-O-[3-hydroxymyristoyl] glucosamine N-acyltransferase
LKLSDLAARLDLPFKGEDCLIRGVNALEVAGPDELSFLANPRYARFLPLTRAAAVIVSREHADKLERALVSDLPYRDFGRALALFARTEGEFSGISPLACIDPTARLGADCVVYPFVFVGPRAELGAGCRLFPGVYVGEDCRLGAGVTLYPHAVLMSATELGDNCIIHAGAVLGAEGFGFTRAREAIQKIPQAGSVRIGEAVEIGANTTVDRGVMGPTRIGSGSKLDNQVQIGHNVCLGSDNLIVAQVGVAGSASIGNGNTIAGQAGVSGHLKIGDKTVLGPRSGVAHDVPDNYHGGGAPLMGKGDYLRYMALVPKLPAMYKTLKKLEKDLEELKKTSGGGSRT